MTNSTQGPVRKYLISAVSAGVMLFGGSLAVAGMSMADTIGSHTPTIKNSTVITEAPRFTPIAPADAPRFTPIAPADAPRFTPIAPAHEAPRFTPIAPADAPRFTPIAPAHEAPLTKAHEAPVGKGAAAHHDSRGGNTRGAHSTAP